MHDTFFCHRTKSTYSKNERKVFIWCLYHRIGTQSPSRTAYLIARIDAIDPFVLPLLAVASIKARTSQRKLIYIILLCNFSPRSNAFLRSSSSLPSEWYYYTCECATCFSRCIHLCDAREQIHSQQICSTCTLHTAWTKSCDKQTKGHYAKHLFQHCTPPPLFTDSRAIWAHVTGPFVVHLTNKYVRAARSFFFSPSQFPGSFCISLPLYQIAYWRRKKGRKKQESKWGQTIEHAVSFVQHTHFTLHM